jgi:UDP-N-acetylglucosamine 2-epimerase
MEPDDFLRLLVNSKCLIGNSSVGVRECSYLGVPTVNIGTRQNRRQRGSNIIDVLYDKEEIKNAIQNRIETEDITPESIYGDGNSGKQIANILASEDFTFHKTIEY